jgi:hypothetical protein
MRPGVIGFGRRIRTIVQEIIRLEPTLMCLKAKDSARTNTFKTIRITEPSERGVRS